MSQWEPRERGNGHGKERWFDGVTQWDQLVSQWDRRELMGSRCELGLKRGRRKP